MDEISVVVVKYPDRKNLVMRYVDPVTGKQKARSTKTSSKREAERVAAKWEAELQEGRYTPSSKITWEEFRERYEREHIASLAAETDRVVFSVLNVVESILRPKRLADVTAGRISHLQSELRNGKRTENTIRSYLKHLRAAMGWAHSVVLIAKVPKFVMPSGQRATS